MLRISEMDPVEEQYLKTAEKSLKMNHGSL